MSFFISDFQWNKRLLGKKPRKDQFCKINFYQIIILKLASLKRGYQTIKKSENRNEIPCKLLEFWNFSRKMLIFDIFENITIFCLSNILKLNMVNSRVSWFNLTMDSPMNDFAL